MPTSDTIFAIIGAVDYLSIFIFILWTALASRKEAAGRQKDCETGK